MHFLDYEPVVLVELKLKVLSYNLIILAFSVQHLFFIDPVVGVMEVKGTMYLV